MKGRIISVVVALALVAALVASTIAQASAAGDKQVRVIVSFKTGTSLQNAGNAAIARHGGIKGQDLPIINGASVDISESEVAALAADPGVKSVEMDQDVSTFGNSPTQVALPSQVVPTGVDRIDAEMSTDTGSGVKIAVIDTGIDYTHPDLAANYKGGYNFVRGNNDPMDDNGHGTHVAGIIAAENNSIGVVGVAPGSSLYAVKVLGKNGTGRLSDVIAGINWAVANGMDAANLSLGLQGTSDALHQAVINATAAGVTLVVAAGNDAADTSLFIPAAYPEVIAVSAMADFDGQPGGLAPAMTAKMKGKTYTQNDDAFAIFSNWGPAVDLAAPGVAILSTWLKGGYAVLSGTSMAAPHVTGAAALYIESQRALGVNPTPAQVCSALEAAGWHSGDAAYFTGDYDPYPEPLVDAGGL